MTARDFECIGFGICAADYLCLLPEYPKLDQKTEALEYSFQGGGPIANALVTLSRLGCLTSFLSVIGDDRNGQYIQDQFHDEKVDTTGIIIDSEISTNQAFIWIDNQTGKRSIVLSSNNRVVHPDELKLNHIKSSKYLLIDGRNADATMKLIHWAKSNNVHIVLDAGSPRENMEEILSAVDYPVASKTFCHSFLKTDDYVHGLDILMSYGAKSAVITCGEDGCYGNNGRDVFHQPSFKVPVVDTTGAGDVFHGAFTYGLIHNWALPETLRFASAVAALKCMKLGGRTGIPNLEIVNMFLDQH